MKDVLARLLLFILPTLGVTCLAQHSDSRGPDIVGLQSVVLTRVPKHVPSGTVVDGAVLGNGDVGIAIGGPPDHLRFYIGKNDFWSQQASPMTVGGVELSIPGLVGASYREQEDLRNAEARGTFSVAKTTVTTRSWVAATENLFVTKLQATGDVDVQLHAALFPKATAITNNDKHINIGREQYGNGRWYFDGLIDEVHLYDRALGQNEVAALANLKESTGGLIRRWGFDAEVGKTPEDTVYKLVTGPPCSTPPSVYRPDEAPLEDATGCKPDGYHLDYQPYGLGIRGRAVKLMHRWDYIDAGDAPSVHQVSIAAWIYIFSSGEANYILSKGAWNDAYSLSLDRGKLRFNVGERFVRSTDALPTHRWIHVCGTFDGSSLRAYVDGQQVIPTARFISGGGTSDTIWISRNADGPLDDQYAWPNPLTPTSTPATRGREVTVAMRVFGEPAIVRGGGIDLILKPGTPVYLVASILSDLDAPDHLAAAEARVQNITIAQIESLNDAHRMWWTDYWSKSYVEFNDPTLEKFYYASQYLIASASRSGKTAPGLYGPWVTTDHPSWNGDYTLDYNHQTPYLALYSSNHVATSDSYDPPILAFMDRAETYAKTLLNARGVYYPGHIGPWGLERPFDYDPFMGMKGNAAFLVMPMLMRFYSTYDDSYAIRVYPFIREVGQFWEDYLVEEDAHYVIQNDCANEVGPWLASSDWDKCPSSHNPMNDLALVRATFKGLIDMSYALDVDASSRPKWKNIIDHLSPYPTGEREGKRIFLPAEPGEEKNQLSSTVPDWGTLAIWPANQIGLGEDPELLRIAQNTVAERGYSNHPLVPPAMARVGYDPDQLLVALRRDCFEHGYPNAYIFFPGGGVETTSTIPATINEMMLQSFSGVLRIFPVWPKKQDASFGNLRAYGAFLISSTFKDGQVKDLTILSEKGRDCVFENPWSGRKLILYRNGTKAEALSGATVTFKTAVNEMISIKPL